MTIDDFADLLRPVAARLLDVPDEKLPPDVALFKSLLCLMMGWAEQFTPEDRAKHFPMLVDAVLPLAMFVSAHRVEIPKAGELW